MDGGTDGLYEFINEDGSPIKMAPGGVGVEPQDATASSKGGSGGLFKTAIMQLSQDTYFKAVVLSMWDNVIGPRCKQVWLGQDRLDDRFYKRLLPFIAKCTLNGEISREIHPEAEAEMKFYVLAELECIMVSFVFGAHVGTSKHADVFSISLVLPIQQMSRYLDLHCLCADRMAALIRKLQVLLQKEGSTSKCLLPFTGVLKPFLNSIADIGVASLPRAIDMSDTVFARGFEWIDPALLRAAVTSHLQTGGVSIVIGREKDQINRIISTLATFLTPGERKRSRYARSGIQSFAPDLVLQGIVVTEREEAFDPHVLMQSAHASTVIDLKRRTVSQTHQENVYHVIQKENEEDELHDHGSRLRANSILHSVRGDSVFVRELLAQVFQPHAPVLREALIEQFKRLITRQALVMVEYVDAIGASPEFPLSSEQKGKMQKELEISTPSDLHILMASAEKYRKGMYLTLLGDPAEKQAQLVDLLAAF